MAEIAVVLVNLGTPDSPELKDVRAYLREFLSDKRIVPMSHVIWRPLLELNVLQFHARASAQKYASVWTPTGSPLLTYAKAQATALQQALDHSQQQFRVAVAMRYGNPALADVLCELHSERIEKVLLIPMYPQYSTTSTATVFDALATHMQWDVDQFEYRTIRAFGKSPEYIAAICARITQTWQQEGRPDFAAGEKLLLSYHGIPEKLSLSGDPYQSECEATTALIRKRLDLSSEECEMTYQSKFGRGEWLTPVTIERVSELGRAQLPRLDVFCPGFVADCLETVEEINILNREAFEKSGGKRFVRIPCLNDSKEFIDTLVSLVMKHTQGWVGA